MEGKHLKMELDTGSVYSVLPYKDYEELFSHIKIRDTSVMIKTYTGQKLSPVGVINVQVKYKSQNLDLYGVPGGKQILFSREWLRKIQLDWTEIHSLHDSVDVPITDGSNPKLKPPTGNDPEFDLYTVKVCIFKRVVEDNVDIVHIC